MEVAMSKFLQDIPLEKQIAKYMRWWETRREEWQRQATSSLQQRVPTLGPYISFSRELASGGAEISRRVADKLGWHHYDREIIEAIAGKTHVREELVSRFDEQIQNGMETYLQNLLTKQLLDNTHYLHHLTQVLLGIAQYGNAVILGRGANFILPPEAGLRVRVVAPLELRCQRLRQWKGYDEKNARLQIAAQDKERRDFFRYHFHSQSNDPCTYDVVINTGHVSVEAATDMLVQLAKTKLQF
jgi:cytidylate kinase